MSYKNILKSVEKGAFDPVYFLSGEESYYIDLISKSIETKALTESEKAFNQQVFYGKDVEFKQIVDAARQFPMLASYRVVIVKEAQYMRDIEKLASYIEQPSPQTILVICYKHKKLDGRKLFGKMVRKKTTFLETKAIRDYQVEAWISEEIKRRGFTINKEASYLLSEYLGADLAKIMSELDKLLINHEPSEKINKDHVQRRIGISKEYNIFELQKALGLRDMPRTNKIMMNFASNMKKHPIQMIHGVLFSYFSKLMIACSYPQLTDQELGQKMKTSYFLKDYRMAARKYSPTQVRKIFTFLKVSDAKSKGIGNKGISEQELLKELVMKIVSVQ